MVQLICKECGNEFEVKPYRAKVALYCCRSCKSKGIYKQTKQDGKGLAFSTNDHKIGNQWRKGITPTNAFKQGHEPWNKDLKGIHLSPETEFKKGSIPENKMAVGSITIRVDDNGKQRKFIKTENPNTWEFYARYVWKQHNGDIPDGFVIHHKNENTIDDSIDNLEMLTRAEHAYVHKENLTGNTAVLLENINEKGE